MKKYCVLYQSTNGQHGGYMTVEAKHDGDAWAKVFRLIGKDMHIFKVEEISKGDQK